VFGEKQTVMWEDMVRIVEVEGLGVGFRVMEVEGNSR
jgi:hypothetical protein